MGIKFGSFISECMDFLFALFGGFSMFQVTGNHLISWTREIVYWQCDGSIIWIEYYRAGASCSK